MNEFPGLCVHRALMLEILLELSWVHAISTLVDVDEIGARPSLTDRLSGGDKRMRNRNDDVTRHYTAGGQSESYGVRSARHADAMRGATEFCKLASEFLYLGPADKPGGVQDVLQGGQ